MGPRRRGARAARRDRLRPRPRQLPGRHDDADAVRIRDHQLRRRHAARRADHARARRPNRPRPSTARSDPSTRPFAGLVFKIQSNMDPAHRDHVAFVRVATGCFERGMTLRRSSNGRQLTTKFAHTMLGNERDTVELAYPGDIVGIVSPGGLTIGETALRRPAGAVPADPGVHPGAVRARPLRAMSRATSSSGVVSTSSPRKASSSCSTTGRRVRSPSRAQSGRCSSRSRRSASTTSSERRPSSRSWARTTRGASIPTRHRCSRSIRCADPRARRRRPARGLRHRVQPQPGAAATTPSSSPTSRSSSRLPALRGGRGTGSAAIDGSNAGPGRVASRAARPPA